ncbi:signal recognition particle protein [Drechmeria coniospora]|uniref:Signal recognition particle subunit SRP72 n=1 Tax=Drechmeria coniospora TaxID=98403 RepID=A0A151GRF7_DRECN|nr:signal recognition particle protein [Drechmeria coniospora]KYK59648.1 signal recognition particle protein [Drechmeria coniospora]
MPPEHTAALTALLRSAVISDDDEVLMAANAAIKVDKSNFIAQHTRVVALLRLDRFEDAVRVIAEGGTKLEAKCTLEKAYALYKLGDLSAAADCLKTSALDNRGLCHIAAQVAYRAERFSETEAIYHRLLDAADESQEDNDLNINIRAAQAQHQWQDFSSTSSLLSDCTPDTFELCYNVACAHIARDDLKSAATLLKRAAQLCDASEELTEEDKEGELKSILAQQAYVHARLGETRQALDLYQSLPTTEDADPNLALVIQNNISVLQMKPVNPFLFHRQTAAWMRFATSAKLFSYQATVLARNAAIINTQAHKTSGVRPKFYEKPQLLGIGQDNNVFSVLNVSTETQGNTQRELLRRLAALSNQRPKDVGLVITMVQLHLQQKNRSAALTVLERFFNRLSLSENGDGDVRFSPGLIALAVSLMESLGRNSSINSELAQAVKYWQDRPIASIMSLLREAGIELSTSSNPINSRLAASAFKKLHGESDESPVVSAGLVATLATSDYSTVERHTGQLPSVQTLVGDTDVRILFNSGVAVTSNSAAASRKRAAPDENPGEQLKRNRRRLRKTYAEHNKPLDPERWLPLRDRSTHRPKGKKGKKKKGESTQGGVVKNDETLELVGGGGVRVEKASGSNTSKKKKGRK